MSAENDVRKASEQFYAALNRMASGDASSMGSIWSNNGKVTAMHPIGGLQVGWENVRESFQQVANLASGGQVKLEDQRIQVVGDLAYELGLERGQIALGGVQAAIDHRVTNVYQRENGSWKMIHHHTDTSPAMLDILKRLQNKS